MRRGSDEDERCEVLVIRFRFCDKLKHEYGMRGVGVLDLDRFV